MTMQSVDDKQHFRAYFSHSYRPEDNYRNLFFWELFEDTRCFFSVDRKSEEPKPMQVSYLEWLMKRSDCFISVVPKRAEPDSPYNCSRYQIFENNMAMRARKPRLLFVEDKLDKPLFKGDDDEICFFHPTEYKTQKAKFLEKIAKLETKVRAFPLNLADSRKPVAVVLNPHKAYTPKIIDAIRETVTNCRFWFGRVLNPLDNFNDAIFASTLEEYEILISEVRHPYIPLDVYASIQSRCLPIIRICYLNKKETVQQAEKEMGLPYKAYWAGRGSAGWPIVLSGYKLDEKEEPVIFWRDIDELTKKIADRLKKIDESKSDDLFTPSQAKRYFLSIGRRPLSVFISNARAQNDLGLMLADRLYDEGVKSFQYRKKDAIEIGTDDWLEKGVYKDIDNSGVFVALLSNDYSASAWCKLELHRAVSLFQKNKLKIFAYAVESML